MTLPVQHSTLAYESVCRQRELFHSELDQPCRPDSPLSLFFKDLDAIEVVIIIISSIRR